MKAALFAAAALAPLTAMLATPALAETVVSGSRTTPIATATANNGGADNIRIETGASVNLTTPGPVVTLNSNNTVTNAGTIAINGVNNATGVLIQGGFTGSFTNAGAINIVEDFTPNDADGDGDIDGAFAQGTGRYGVRVTGAAPFSGNISTNLGSTLQVRGVDSFGLAVEAGVVGNITNGGLIAVIGDRSTAVSISGPVTGAVRSNGTINATGAGAVGLSVTGPVTGSVAVQGAVTATGYRYTSRPPLPAQRQILDADDLLQGGPAVRIAADVSGGFLLDAAPVDLLPNNPDEDADGTPDAEEGTGSLTVYGGAPALDVGFASSAITIGAVGTGANAYGIVLRGGVTADGVYDGVAATAARIGQPGGGAVNVVGGVNLEDGSLGAISYAADATGLRVSSGATVPEIRNSAVVAATANTDGTQSATALLFDVGATVNTITNSGALVAQINGERGTAQTVVDRSGSLNVINNTGQIQALIFPTDGPDDLDDPNTDPSDEVVTGSRIAVDVRANTTGVLIRQTGRLTGGTGFADADGDGVSDGDEPAILGSILFGAGNDTLDVLNGAVVGDVAFGAGEDVLNVAGGALVQGAVRDSDGRLSLGVVNGTLALTNAETVNVTSVNVGTDGALVFSADPRSGAATRVVASGAVNIASGAQVGLRLNSLQRTAAEYAVLTGASFNVGTLDTALLASTPYLYVTNVRTDQASNTLFIGVRPKTAVELELNRSETQAYQAVFNQLDADARIEAAALNQTTRAGLVALYDQLLPDHSGGALLSLSAVNDAISNVLGSRTDPIGRIGPNGAWAQEVFFNLRHDRENAQGFQSRGFGVTGGLEGIGTDNGALGLTASFVTADYEDTDAAVGERVSFSMIEIGGYWRRQWGGLRFDARGAAGVVLFDSNRRVVSAADNLLLTSMAEWTGYSASGHLGLSYQTAGRYYVRPYGTLDAVYLSEGGYDESGAGAGVDLAVDSRSGGVLFGSVGVTAGARFGTDFWWGPEVTVGYRSALAGQPGSTTARFRTANATSFTLDPEDVEGGGLQIRIALRAGTQRGYVAFEAGGEARDGYSRYDIRLVAKVYF